MKEKSAKSIRLYRFMLKQGYPEGFCDIITQNLNTDYTAGRMLGYLAHFDRMLPAGEIADEMLAILSDRDSFIRKKETEAANAAWNMYLNEGFGVEEDPDEDPE